MKPVSVVAASFSIAGPVAKTSSAIFEFSLHAKEAADDLGAVNQELQALNAVLESLSRSHSQFPNALPADLLQKFDSSLSGCARVVSKIDATIEKYQQDGGWTRTNGSRLGAAMWTSCGRVWRPIRWLWAWACNPSRCKRFLGPPALLPSPFTVALLPLTVT